MQQYLASQNFKDIGSGVYVIRCLPTSQIYIGSTNNFARRWDEHRTDLELGRHCNYRLQRAWDRHGHTPSNFLFEILERTHPADRLTREQAYLDRYRPWETGFNIQRSVWMSGTRARPSIHARKARRILARTLLTAFVIMWVIAQCAKEAV